jgi:L-ascorbate metabolism protein UlaG (beta-lactamase superfamily)
MRRWKLALGGLLGVMAAAGTAVEARAQSDAWMQTFNNNRIIDFQKNGGDPAASGDVQIDFLGHAAFRVTSPDGIELLVDPWRNDPSGAWGIWFPEPFPEVEVDAVLSTHAHFDHDAVYRPQASMVLDRMASGFALGDVRVIGYADKHVCDAPGWYNWTHAVKEFGQEPCPPNNPGHLDNVIFDVRTGGMRIVVWGDNRHDPAAHVWEELAAEDIDVLIMPVDSSQHILSYEQSTALVEKLNPHVVIPEHYLTAGLSITLTTLGTAEEWVRQQPNHTMLDSGTITLSPESVAGKTREVMYFGGNAAIE